MAANDVLLCMGTRPEIIKMAPVYDALRRTALKPVVVHTGQHDELSRPHYRFFGIVPQFDIRLVRERGSLAHLFALLIERLDHVVESTRPAAVLVQGDTSSALAGALAAYYHKIPVGHIEAGLRSHQEYEPFPEEKNRELIARLAHWHFVPTARADANLAAEGVVGARRYRVGNTIVDAVHWGLGHLDGLEERSESAARDLLQWVAAGSGPLLLVTAHRRESWDGRILGIAEGVQRALASIPDLRVVWPVHPNPKVRAAVERALGGVTAACADRLRLTGPLGYPQLLWVLKRARLVLTDSGGIQEEAVSVGTPVLVARHATERPEVIESGAGILVGTDPLVIEQWIGRVLRDEDLYRSLHDQGNPFGDGRAGPRIAEVLVNDILGQVTEEANHGQEKHSG
jgi:UDP-N-acetylglucosamine 2-epimerase